MSSIQDLEKLGFKELTYKEGRGLCGISGFLFTTGLCYNIDSDGTFEGRYCYPHEKTLEAVMSLKVWSGLGDPPGGWIKHKGVSGEYSNKRLEK